MFSEEVKELLSKNKNFLMPIYDALIRERIRILEASMNIEKDLEWYKLRLEGRYKIVNEFIGAFDYLDELNKQ